MIVYEFTVDKFPQKVTGPSSLSGFIEGDFSILVEGNLVFSEPEFLVFEYFQALEKWVLAQKGTSSDFYFKSMDYEEEPIVAFVYDSDLRKYQFESVFKRVDGEFGFNDIVASYEQFSNDLRECLATKYDYKLKK